MLVDNQIETGLPKIRILMIQCILIVLVLLGGRGIGVVVEKSVCLGKQTLTGLTLQILIMRKLLPLMNLYYSLAMLFILMTTSLTIHNHIMLYYMSAKIPALVVLVMQMIVLCNFIVRDILEMKKVLRRQGQQ